MQFRVLKIIFSGYHRGNAREREEAQPAGGGGGYHDLVRRDVRHRVEQERGSRHGRFIGQ